MLKKKQAKFEVDKRPGEVMAPTSVSTAFLLPALLAFLLYSEASPVVAATSVGRYQSIERIDDKKSADQPDKLYDYLIRYAACVHEQHLKDYAKLLPLSEKLYTDFKNEHLDDPAVSSKYKSPHGLDEVTPLVRVPKSYGNAFSRLHLELLTLRGNARSHSTAKLKDALADHKLVVQKCPNFIEGRISLATHYRLTRQFDQALETIEEAIKLDPNNYLSYTTRAMIYQDMGDAKNQNASMQESYRLRTAEEREINNYLGKSISPRGNDLDPRNARRLIEQRPRNANAISTYAESINPPRPHDAKKYATIAIVLDPAEPMAYNDRADINLDLGNFKESVADADVALRLQPDSLESRITRGIALMNLNKLDQALADLNFVVKADPEFLDAYNYRSSVYLEMGDIQRAIADAKKALTLDVEWANSYNMLGNCYMKQKRYEDAKQMFATSVRLERKFHGYASPVGRFKLGYCYYKLKNFDLANREFDKALIGDPELAERIFDRAAAAAVLQCRNDEIKAALGSGLLPAHPLVEPKVIEQSIVIYSRLSALNSRKLKMYCRRGERYLCLNKLNSAILDFRKAVKIESSNRDQAIPLLFLAQERMKTNSQARSELKENLALTKSKESSPLSGSALALCKFLLGESSESQIWTNTRGTADNTRAHAYLAYHYASLGDKTKARQHLEWVLLQGTRKSLEYVLALTELERLCAK